MKSVERFLNLFLVLQLVVRHDGMEVEYRSYDSDELAKAIEAWRDNRKLLKEDVKIVQTSRPLTFLHLPKTAGTAIRYGLPRHYLETFSWGREFTEEKCNVNRASRFHLTQGESVRCGVVLQGYWQTRFVLCTVRDPLQRAISELKFNYKGDVEKYIQTCTRAQEYPKDKMMIHDVIAHCRSQTEYLYDKDKIPLCDMIIDDPSKHRSLLLALNISKIPVKKKVNKSPDIDLNRETLQRLESWIREVHRPDFDDPLIANAIRPLPERRVVLPDTKKMPFIQKSSVHDNSTIFFWLPNNPPTDFFRPYWRRPGEGGRQNQWSHYSPSDYSTSKATEAADTSLLYLQAPCLQQQDGIQSRQQQPHSSEQHLSTIDPPRPDRRVVAANRRGAVFANRGRSGRGNRGRRGQR